MNSSASGNDAQFPSTHWSSVQAAGVSVTQDGAVALERLLRRYESPIEAYVKDKWRCDDHKAQDLFQGFVLDIVLKRQLITQARQMKGHLFRSFLLSALRNYVTSVLRKDFSQRRFPEGGFAPLDDLSQAEERAADAPTASFDVQWAHGVVAESLRRMEAACKASGHTGVWEVFDQRLRRPILEGAAVRPYGELVAELGFSSPIQAQNALVTAKRMFPRILRSVVSEYTGDETDVEVEVRELQLILAHAPSA
jgi:DNA-directed RNA polymerase specialized sigma24 family protein